MLNFPRPLAQLLQGIGTTFPRVASKHPKRICFLLESPPVSTSDPGSTPALHGKDLCSGIATNLSSIVVAICLDFLMLFGVSRVELSWALGVPLRIWGMSSVRVWDTGESTGEERFDQPELPFTTIVSSVSMHGGMIVEENTKHVRVLKGIIEVPNPCR